MKLGIDLSGMKTDLFKGLLLAMVTVGATSLQAEEALPDTFQLRLGGYLVADEATDVKVSKNGVGATINVQDTFNMDTTTQVLRLDGYYRFTPAHRVEFSWYSIHNDGSTNESFQWGDENITANGYLDTKFDTDIYKINYVYSFYHNEKVELGLSAGLHITTLDVGFDGSYNVDGNLSDAAGESENVTAPLPVVGFRLGYNILPQLSVKYSVDYFFITYDETTGGYVDTLLTVDWRVTRHFGLGVGANSTRLRLESDLEDDKELNVQHDVFGGLVYATMNF